MALSVNISMADLEKDIAEAISLKGNRKLMSEIGEAFMKNVHEGFFEGKDPDGKAWEKLKNRTGSPLLDTGNFYSSIRYEVKSDSEVVIWAPIPWASTHQYGATIKPKNGPYLVFNLPGFSHPVFAKEVTIPARRFMPEGYLPPAYARDVLSAVEEFFGGGR